MGDWYIDIPSEIFFPLWVGILIALGYFVYRDARNKVGMPNTYSVAWGLACIVLPALGLIAYLVIRSNTKSIGH